MHTCLAVHSEIRLKLAGLRSRRWTAFMAGLTLGLLSLTAGCKSNPDTVTRTDSDSKTVTTDERDTSTTTNTEFDHYFTAETADQPIANNIQVIESRAVGVVGIQTAADGIQLKIKAISHDTAVAQFTFPNLANLVVNQAGKEYNCKAVSEDRVLVFKNIPVYWTLSFPAGWDPAQPFDLLEKGDCGQACLQFSGLQSE
ncbi:MAG: hypothetical protein KDK39_04485 [Leptospiraceae bacterium]|nr:hypothetical protein [Leptospiraceae bacterium]